MPKPKLHSVKGGVTSRYRLCALSGHDGGGGRKEIAVTADQFGVCVERCRSRQFYRQGYHHAGSRSGPRINGVMGWSFCGIERGVSSLNYLRLQKIFWFRHLVSDERVADSPCPRRFGYPPVPKHRPDGIWGYRVFFG